MMAVRVSDFQSFVARRSGSNWLWRGGCRRSAGAFDDLDFFRRQAVERIDVLVAVAQAGLLTLA